MANRLQGSAGRLAGVLAAVLLLAAGGAARAAERPPNFVVILTDDQGYADLGCYGAEKIETPEIDRMAAEGMRFTNFLAAAPICTPTRAALMTGCYATRVGLGTPLHTPDQYGLNPEEITLAELLKDFGYATGCVGKWHLGHHEPFLPTRQGFDYYYGTPMGHMFRVIKPEEKRTELFLRNEEVIPHPPSEDLTDLFTEEAVQFIERHQSEPFFLYLAHSMPHIPLLASERFRGTSAGGLYGDVIETIDWSTGRVLQAIRDAGLAEDTYVIFTSDNGPHTGDGSPGPFRGGKHSAYQGGMRVPGIVWAPGRVKAGTVSDAVVSTIDLYPTIAGLADAGVRKALLAGRDASAPFAGLADAGVRKALLAGRDASAPFADRVIDGADITPLLHGEPGAKSPHEQFLYYVRDGKTAGIRVGDWKLLVDVESGPWSHEGDALYDLGEDPGEQRNLAAEMPEKVKELRGKLTLADETLRRQVRPPGVVK